jgi:hypothetical protein
MYVEADKDYQCGTCNVLWRNNVWNAWVGGRWVPYFDPPSVSKQPVEKKLPAQAKCRDATSLRQERMAKHPPIQAAYKRFVLMIQSTTEYEEAAKARLKQMLDEDCDELLDVADQGTQYDSDLQELIGNFEGFFSSYSD